MTVDDYNTYCASLPHTTHVVQWMGSHVWKIGDKMFAVAYENKADGALHVTFKVSDMGFDIMKEQPGCRPAPHLASRGMKWIQRTSDETLSDPDLCEYIAESYRIVGSGLTKKKQRELGLIA